MGITKLLIRLGLFGSGLFLATLLAVMVWTYSDNWPSTKDLRFTDSVVCLGGGMYFNKIERRALPNQRAATCAQLFLDGKTNTIVFTGAGPSPEPPPLAALMAQHAMSLGVPETAIFIEPNARSTLQNALFSMPIIPEAKSIRIVTDSFHIPRSWMSFYWAGYPEITVYPSQGENQGGMWWENTRAILRETLAIWFNLARLPVYSAAKAMNIPNAERLLH